MTSSDPLFNTLSMKVVFRMARERRHIILTVILDHAYRASHIISANAATRGVKFVRTELNPGKVLQDLGDHLLWQVRSLSTVNYQVIDYAREAAQDESVD